VSLEPAKTPWILMLDADERIAERDLHVLVEATRRDCTGYRIPWRNYGYNPTLVGWKANEGEYEEGNAYPGYVDDPMFRLYRNDSRLRYRGVVHEYIDLNAYPNSKVETLKAVIHHYGRALTPERLAEKGEFYLRLGYDKIQQNPGRWESYLE